MRGPADCYQVNLLEIGILVILIRLTFCGSNLLNGGTRRHDWSEILTINFVKCWRIGQVVQIHVCCHHLTKVHPRFFEVVEEIAHSLPKLMLGSGRVDAAMWPGDEAAFG